MRWGDERTYTCDFLLEPLAFLGIERHSIVAVCSYGLVKSGYIRLPGKVRMSKAEYAIVNSNLNAMYHSRLVGKGRIDVPIGDYRYEVIVHDFDEYTIITRRRLV